jgi:hypothetical protein
MASGEEDQMEQLQESRWTLRDLRVHKVRQPQEGKDVEWRSRS